MVKFQKQLEGQLVPEWRNAYVNYKQLKKIIGQIREQIVLEQQVGNATHGGQHRPTFSICTTRSRGGNLLVVNHKGQPHDLLGSEAEESYQTELLGPLPWLELEDIFFSRLDSQLNMVNNFYKIKEREFLLRGKQLEVQLETLAEIRGQLAACKIGDQDDCEKEIDIESCEKASTTSAMKNGTFCVSRSNVGHAQKMLRTAFVEHYKGLTLLQNYSSLNTLAFAKILKKYDKVTGKAVLDTYLRAVETSYFSSSHKVVSLVEKVEALFTKHFSKNDRREAMVCLRPSPRPDSKKKTFCLGIFTGCSWSLFFTLVLVLSTHSQIADYLESSSFRISVYPVFSTFALLLFHTYMYGLNLYLWERKRINYAFIFEFAPGTELRCLEVLLLSTGLTTIFTACVLSHLVLITSRSSALVKEGQIIPITSFLVFLLFTVLPFNICYKSTRYYFLRCVWRTICSSLYKVKFADFFLADQFTSQITALRNLENISCYYASRYYNGGAASSDICSQNQAIQHFELFVAILPYWWRLLQCLRRWRDDRKDQSQIANGGKYISALIAVLVRLTYETNQTKLCLALYIVSSTIATVYQFYWDVVMDWGLLQRKSVNPWLRDQLILKSRSPYFISMAADALLRLTWLYSLILHQVCGFESIDRKHLDFIFGMAEIARRGMWNFYRVENEHLNNVGKFRAVKTVPLPFKDIGQEG
eukprot:PITA_32366